MAGFMFVMVACAGCKKLGMRKMITVNADHDPTIPVDGREKSVCRQCFDFFNEARISKGLEPRSLHPKAYLEVK